VIFWTSEHGAFVVRGAIKAAWDKLGGPTGKLGAPVADQTANRDVLTQKFTAGQIAWDEAKNTFSTQPADLASSLSGLQVPGQKMPAGSATGSGGLSGKQWWRWLVVAVPTLLLLAIAGLVASRWRRRRRRDNQAVEHGADGAGYEAVTEAVSQWSPEADRDLASSSLDDGYRAALRPRTVRLPSQSASEWGPPSRADFVDEPAIDEVESRAQFSEVAVDDVDEHFDDHVDEHFDEHFDEDPDDVDTAPTRIPAASEVRTGGRHAAAHDDDEEDTTHLALATPLAQGQLAIHLPMDDPYQVPDGYPVKANASFGVYYMPDSALYDDTLAEIWFATEEIAQANGFHKAD
jgi:uncharacterized protein with LGFP repeats